VQQTPFDIFPVVEDELLLVLDPPPRHEVCELGVSSEAVTSRWAVLSKLRS
jgi:hypothetical protein